MISYEQHTESLRHNQNYSLADSPKLAVLESTIVPHHYHAKLLHIVFYSHAQTAVRTTATRDAK